MYVVRKTGYVIGIPHNPPDVDTPQVYRVTKYGRVLTLREESLTIKNTDLASLQRTGYRYYRIIAENDERLCAVCSAQAGAVYPVFEAKEGINLPPFTQIAGVP